jgi:hypothetical protein
LLFLFLLLPTPFLMLRYMNVAFRLLLLLLLQVVFFLVGTVAGGTLGLVLMWHSALASNPYALMALLVAASFWVGLLGGHLQYRTTLVLTLMTLTAMVLCQYNSCCSSTAGGTAGGTGSTGFYVVRVVSIFGGAFVAVLVNNTVLPWFNSDWCLEMMAGFYVGSVKVLRLMFERFYNDGLEAEQRYYAGRSDRIRQQQQQQQQQEEEEGGVILEVKDADVGPNEAAAGAGVVPNSAGSLADGDDETGGSKLAAAGTGAGAAAGGPSGGGGAAASDVENPQLLQGPGLGGALVAVQVSLMRDAAAWSRGVLATPKVRKGVRWAFVTLPKQVDELLAGQLMLDLP